MRLCWVIPDAGYYHVARLMAFSHTIKSETAVLLTVTSVGDLPEFNVGDEEQNSNEGRNGFVRRTLFPDRPYKDISARDLSHKIAQVLGNIKPEVVCINGWGDRSALVTLLWCKNTGTPTVVMSDSGMHDARRMWWKEAIKKRVLRLCDAGLVGGPPHADYLAALGMSKSRIYLGYDVVDNRHFEMGADAARLDASRTRRLLALPDDYFLAIGRFVEKKNYAWLLKTYAAYRVRAGVNAWKLVVLGDGILREKLVKIRNELGLDDWVILPGAKRYEELPAYYALAGAFVHASKIEQWGLVVNEAMAAGLPVLLSDKCGCADSLINRGINGFLFDPRNGDELASLMLRISSSEPEGRAAMGLASRKIISRWSPRIFAENLYKAAQAAQIQQRTRVTWLDRALLWALIHR